MLVLALAAGAQARAQARGGAPSVAELRVRLAAFLNRSIGWQGLDKLQIESISAPDGSGLRTAKVLLAKGTQQQEGVYYITADGKEIIEGAKSELSADPWASTRAAIDLRGAPSEGAADAPVTIVEFSDLECPYCRQEATALEQLMSQDPGKARIVFKYYPLTQIHPWAMPAAKAAVCVAAQHPAQFWNFEKAVFAAQEQIPVAGAPQRLRDFALESEAQPAAFDACLNDPATVATIHASIANGNRVGVTSTPTLFIDGRIVPGAIAEQELRLLVDHEAQLATPARSSARLSTGTISGKQCGACKPLPPIKH
ncbi:MAG TPA: thioredoxin domain-containing protein [Terriglobales bacterium]|nr:thioredoxin domain-containing protein [Terriglobales bacterium]